MKKKASGIVSPAVTQSAAYRKRILATVSRELTEELRGGFGYATVNRAIQFAQFFPDPAIVSTLSTQLVLCRQEGRAAYGKQILATLSQELTQGSKS